MNNIEGHDVQYLKVINYQIYLSAVKFECSLKHGLESHNNSRRNLDNNHKGENYQSRF